MVIGSQASVENDGESISKEDGIDDNKKERINNMA